jgi:hypothetical protein
MPFFDAERDAAALEGLGEVSEGLGGWFISILLAKMDFQLDPILVLFHSGKLKSL